jgi:hypothetical protein
MQNFSEPPADFDKWPVLPSTPKIGEAELLEISTL